MKLYLIETEREFRNMWGDDFPLPDMTFGQDGVVSSYEAWFGSLGIDFRASGANIEIIREVVATRNLAQHPESIALMHLSQRPVDREKFPRPFFGHPLERQMYDNEQEHEIPWLLSIAPDSIAHAIDEIVKFGEWLDRESLSGPKALPAPAAEASPGERIGVVTRYLGKIRVAGVQLDVDIAKGDTLRFIQSKRDFEQEARSIQLNKVAVEVAPAGSLVGIEVEHPIREGAAVYRVRKTT